MVKAGFNGSSFIIEIRKNQTKMNPMSKNIERITSYAVLTGDVVGSSKLAPEDLKSVMQQLREGAVQFSETFPNSIFGKLDVFSGDGWQLLMLDQKRSLRAALFLRAQVMSFKKLKLDTRIAIAWGAVDKETLNSERISESTGEAFTESGRALKNMKKSCKLTLHYGQSLSDLSLLKDTISLIDEIAKHWTSVQAQTISFALLNQSQENIAVTIGKSQPTIHQALHSGGWHSIENFLKEIEYRLENL